MADFFDLACRSRPGLRQTDRAEVPKIGRLDKAWDEANAKGWTVVDMKQDWKTVFPDKP